MHAGQFCVVSSIANWYRLGVLHSKSQIQTYLEQNEGPGLQHLALKTDDILTTMKEMRQRSACGGFQFMPRASEAYYRALPARIGDALSPEQYKAIEDLGILADKDDQVTGRLLREKLDIHHKPYRGCCCRSLHGRWVTAPPFFWRLSSVWAASVQCLASLTRWSSWAGVEVLARAILASCFAASKITSALCRFDGLDEQHVYNIHRTPHDGSNKHAYKVNGSQPCLACCGTSTAATIVTCHVFFIGWGQEQRRG